MHQNIAVFVRCSNHLYIKKPNYIKWAFSKHKQIQLKKSDPNYFWISWTEYPVTPSVRTIAKLVSLVVPHQAPLEAALSILVLLTFIAHIDVAQTDIIPTDIAKTDSSNLTTEFSIPKVAPPHITGTDVAGTAVAPTHVTPSDISPIALSKLCSISEAKGQVDSGGFEK